MSGHLPCACQVDRALHTCTCEACRRILCPNSDREGGQEGLLNGAALALSTVSRSFDQKVRMAGCAWTESSWQVRSLWVVCASVDTCLPGASWFKQTAGCMTVEKKIAQPKRTCTRVCISQRYNLASFKLRAAVPVRPCCCSVEELDGLGLVCLFFVPVQLYAGLQSLVRDENHISNRKRCVCNSTYYTSAVKVCMAEDTLVRLLPLFGDSWIRSPSVERADWPMAQCLRCMMIILTSP